MTATKLQQRRSAKRTAGSLERMFSPRRNPKESVSKCGHWWKPAQYPEGTIVCPVCWLPETTGEYRKECHCWDDQRANADLRQDAGSAAPQPKGQSNDK